MTTQTVNESTYRRLLDATNSGDLERISRTIDEIFHPDAVLHSPAGTAPAAAAVKTAWSMLLTAFPDIQVTAEDTITEGDKVVLRNTVTATHQGEYRGLPPTGTEITYGEIFIIRFVDGKVAEGWGLVDLYSQLQQLGALPG